MNAARNFILFDDSSGPVTEMLPTLNLLVEWEHPWHSFVTSIRPALAYSEPPLAGECSVGARNRATAALSFLLHFVALLVILSIPAHMLRSYQLLNETDDHNYHILYYSGIELPRMQDAGGAQDGLSGRSGGRELYHPTQVIRIARGNRLVDTVVDAPDLKLPRTNEAVANVLAMRTGDPGPAPAGMLHVPTGLLAGLQATPVVAPQKVTRDRLQTTPDLIAGAVNAPPEAVRQIAGLRLPEIGTAAVIPPPVSAPPRAISGNSGLSLPASVAVAPPPQVSRRVSNVGVIGFGAMQDVVPPAPRAGGRALSGIGVPGGLGNGTEVVGPPPQTTRAGMGGGGMIGGAMKALGALLGGASGPSGSGGGGDSTGIIVSAKPGGALGVPGHGGPGTLSMSPNGGSQPGLGGSGGGTGIGHGTGPGSGTAGSGPGAAKSGSRLGAGGSRPGTSTYPGPGGSGAGSGNGGMSGVTISGGVITIPSFSTPANTGSGMSRPGKDGRGRPSITIIASARAGGALGAYGVLKGAKVYTIYIDTRLGTAVLQYAERSGSSPRFEDDLAAPEPLRAEIPSDIKRSRLLVSCMMDKTGALKNIRVLESASPDPGKLLAALEKWIFRPVLRGDEPVEVDVMLGFDINTR